MQYVVSRPRVGVFIDTQNLYHSARDLLERTVNFETILRSATGGANSSTPSPTPSSARVRRRRGPSSTSSARWASRSGG